MDDYSTCPLCGGIMDKGHLTAGGYRIIWTQKSRRLSNMLDVGDELVEKLRITGKLGNIAWRCRSCKKILLSEYGEQQYNS